MDSDTTRSETLRRLRAHVMADAEMLIEAFDHVHRSGGGEVAPGIVERLRQSLDAHDAYQRRTL